MKRFALTLTVSAAVAAMAPASALAHHRGNGHHKRHRGSAHGVRFERFGNPSAPSSTGTTGNGGNTNNGGGTNAGKVQSFDPSSGKLTIVLSDNTTMVSGLVTGNTWISCPAPSSNGSPGSSGDNDADDQPSSGSGGSGSGDWGAGGSSQGRHHGDNPDMQGNGGGDQGKGDDQGSGDDDNGGHGQPGSGCGTSSLAQNTPVMAATLELSSAGATWKQVALGS